MFFNKDKLPDKAQNSKENLITFFRMKMCQSERVVDQFLIMVLGHKEVDFLPLSQNPGKSRTNSFTMRNRCELLCTYCIINRILVSVLFSDTHFPDMLRVQKALEVCKYSSEPQITFCGNIIVRIASQCCKKEKEIALSAAVEHQWETKASTSTEQNHRGLRNNWSDILILHCIVCLMVQLQYMLVLPPEYYGKVETASQCSVRAPICNDVIALQPHQIKYFSCMSLLQRVTDLQHAHSS